ncbi:alpha/beta fold hydrolase [Marisediminicola sp. LYQ134]|uniref:alpha/beta fold hydrolase n=1 Tax=unclassified Marisediminicola TaxID=2618316 RepID=UPI003983BA8B
MWNGHAGDGRSRSGTDPVTEPYAEWDLDIDPRAFDLVASTVVSELGSCVARHHATRTGEHATIFLHGAAGTWTTWTPLLRAAAAEGVAVADPVLVDLPGWGDAELTRDESVVSITAVAALVAQAARSLGYTSWTVIGHSLGGLVAMQLAARSPHETAGVGMISGTTFAVIRSVEHPVRHFRDVPAFTMLLGVMRSLARFGVVGRRLVVLVGRTGLLRVIFAPLFRHARRIPRSLIEATARDLRPRSFVIAADATRGYDPRSEWSTIRCPVRATRGDRDVFVTDRDLAELESAVPGSRVTVIEDCGHFATIERPRAVLRALGLA